MSVKNLDFFRCLPEGITIQEVGTRLYEALADVDSQNKTIAQQTNANPTGQPLPPPAIDSLTVTGQNGIFHLQIQHKANFYRDIQYHVEYADNPSFQNPRPIDLGASREHSTFLGNGTYYWRAFAAYPSSAAGPPAYHGGQHSPQPVSGGGFIGGPAFLSPQGSGTGQPGEGPSGPGPIPFRTDNGVPPIRGASVGNGGSSGGSLAPSPATGLPNGLSSITPGGSIGGGGGSSSPLTTKGDIWGFSSLDVAVPTGGITKDGYVLTADSTATAGVSYQPWAYASKSLIGQTTGSGPFNLQHASAVLPAGLYRVICYVSINGTGAGLAVQVSYTWTDERGNSFAPAPTVITGVPPTPMWGNAPIDVHTDGVTNLTVNFGNAGTGTFDVYVVVIRLL